MRIKQILPLQIRLFFVVMMIFSNLLAGVSAGETAPAGTWVKQYYAPYVDMSGYPSYFLWQIAETTGVRYFSLGFVQAQHTTCQGRWSGVTALEHPYLLNDLEKLRAAGGDVIVSFGGASGTELGRACLDVAGLKAAYQEVVEIYGVTHLDFDIEGDDLLEPASMQRRSEAIAALQAEYAGTDYELVVSYTLPVQPTGLTDTGLAALELAIEAGVQVDIVNIMTMNFSREFPGDRMGANTMQAAESLVGQLHTLYPEKSETELWAMVGLTPMIGINDVMADIFTQQDAEAVTAFAIEKGITRLAMWSLDRDEECISQQPIVSGKCSGTIQPPFAYSLIFNRITLPLEK